MPTNKVIDSNLVVGEAIFGLGWGIAGLCPGALRVSILFLPFGLSLQLLCILTYFDEP